MRFDFVLALYQRCLFLTVSGNAKASEGGTDDERFPRFFMYRKNFFLAEYTGTFSACVT